MSTAEDIISYLGPWRHNIYFEDFSTFDVADSVGPFRNISHPHPRAKMIMRFLPEEDISLLDAGCNAGGISFYIENVRDGYSIDGVDNSQDGELETHPLVQAFICKHIKDSDVNFIEYDVLDYLRLRVEYDIIIAAGLLYHIRSNGGRNTQKEKEFIDLLIESSNQKFIIETNPTPWLEEYIRSRGCNIEYHGGPQDTPAGVRQFLVVGLNGSG